MTKRLPFDSVRNLRRPTFLSWLRPLNEMGVTTSREFSDAVSTYVNGGGNLENLLEDPKVVNFFPISTSLTDI